MNEIPARVRALLLIGTALVVCNLAAMFGVALVDARAAVEDGRGGSLVALAVKVFQPTAALEDPTGSLHAADHPQTRLTRAWGHWDSSWYLSIARDGYWYVPGEQSPVAYFPAYPLTIAGAAAVGVNRFVAGVLLTMAFGCAGLFLFGRWAARLVGEEGAQRATALFLIYPYAFFLFGAMYSDATFLVASVGAFYALERGKLAAVVLLGAVATAARPIGTAVVVGLVARRLELRAAAGEPIRASDFVPALAGAGLGAYMLFLWARFGDPLAFAHVQSAPGWDHLVGPRSYFKIPLLEMIARSPMDTGTWVRLVHGSLALGAIACAVPMWRRLGKGYAVYVATVIGIPLASSKDFMGLGRYTMAAFPVFLMLALLLEARPRLRRLVMAAGALALLFFAALFGADNFVA